MKNKLYILVAIVIGFSSCTEKIDFDLNTEKSRLVVEGNVSSGKGKHSVKLTKTTSYFYSEKAPVVENASVKISDGTDSWTLVEEKPGYYFTPEIEPKTGKTYTITVDAEGQTYTAQERMELVVEFDSIVVRKKEEFDFGEGKDSTYYSIFLYAQEPPNLGDYYLWKYWIKRPSETKWHNMTPTYKEWVYADDEFINGNNPSTGWELFNEIPVDSMPKDSEVRMEMYKITKSYYEFLDAIGNQTQRSGFFDGPPANIPSNFNNGALGYFYAAAVDSAFTTVKE